MKSKIQKSVIPFGALAAVLLVLFIFALSLSSSSSTYANNSNAAHVGRILTIHDQGTEKVIITQEITIGDALKAANINIDPRDVVEPALTERLIASDYQVNIYRARPVIIIDNNVRIKVSTAFQTAEQIVKSADIMLYDEDNAVISQNENAIIDGAGLKVVINRAVPVELLLFGKNTTVRTHANTVAEMLTEKNIELGRDDRISLEKNTLITPGISFRIWREGKQVVTVTEDVDYEIEKIEDADRDVSYRVVTIPGEKGSRNASYEITIQDGVEVSRTEIASVITKQPQKQTEIVGVKGQYTTPSENETITWNYLTSNGFSRIQAAGIMGNLMQEHGFETTDAGGGFGIAQWTGGRRLAIMSIPNSNNIYVQLDFLMGELNGDYYYVRDGIKSTNSLESAVEIFQNQFERCNPRYCMLNQRIDYARNILASH